MDTCGRKKICCTCMEKMGAHKLKKEEQSPSVSAVVSQSCKNDPTPFHNFSTFSTCFYSSLFPHVPLCFIITPFLRHHPPPPPPPFSHAHRWFSAAPPTARSQFISFWAERWVRFWSSPLLRRACFHLWIWLSPFRFVPITCSLKLLQGRLLLTAAKLYSWLLLT